MQKKINIALGAAVLALSASNIYLFCKLQDKASQQSVDTVSDSVIALDVKVTPLLNKSKSGTHLVGENIEDFLMEQPEIIVKSLAKYRFEQEQLAKQQEAKNIKESMELLYSDESDPFFGNPNGKHQLVLFTDYNCGFCKKLSPTLEQLVEIDPEVKVIVKEFPIFQQNTTSAYSALMATAVYYYKPELYGVVHNALMATPQLTRTNIDDSIAKLGINLDALKPFMDKAKAQIEKVRQLGMTLNVTGTPTIFIGSERTHGGWTAGQFKAMFQ